jgi:Icc-related predicted phosphoesterase
VRIVAFSDTHGYHKKLTIPDGDMLICAGDFSMRAKMHNVTEFARWFKAQPHQYKIIVPGNHDMFCEGNISWCRTEFEPAVLLNHEEKEVAGYRVFGSPYSSAIHDPSDWSFDYPPGGRKSKELWDFIPSGIDILITHGPPKGILDLVRFPAYGEDPHVGDANLLENVKRVLPRIHLFGHIHEGSGSYTADTWTTKFYNTCICDVRYDPTNPVTVIDF